VADPIDTLRLLLNDVIMDYTDSVHADGIQDTFYSSHKPMLSAPDVSVDGSAATPTVTQATGKMVFLSVPTEDQLVVAAYTAAMFTDAEIQMFFDRFGAGVNYDLAAAAGWRAKAAKFVEEVSFTADGLEVQNSAKYRAALQQAMEFERKGKSPEAQLAAAGGEGGVPYVGGIDKDDKQMEEEDTSRVKPAFARDMMRPSFDTITLAIGNTSEDVR